MKHLTLHVIWAWVAFENTAKNFLSAILDQSSLFFDRSSLAELNSNFLQLLDSKFTLKKTLSKPKPRLIVLIMVCQHIHNGVPIHLVAKVIESNNLLL